MLLDTHILIWRLSEPRRLSREQTRALDLSEQRGQAFLISAATLIELALLRREEGRRIGDKIDSIFSAIDDNPSCRILPVTVEIAREFAAISHGLRDPIDSAIVATARVHRLKLLTSDERIIGSRLVPVVE